MKLGSLFSGGGSGDLGFMAAGMDITWQCEIDEYCQKILELRYPESKKYRDIKTLKGSELEPVDIITGGFPCQPFSVAGQQMGKSDDRHLWPEMFRVIKECGPRWIVGENVAGIINLALAQVCSDLEAAGYETWPVVFPSHVVGASHKRDRVWIVAHSKCDRFNWAQNHKSIGTSIQEEQAGPIDPQQIMRTSELSSTSRIVANPNIRSGNTGTEPTGRQEGKNFSGSGTGTALANTKSNGTQGRIFKQGREPLLSQCGETMADAYAKGLQGWYETLLPEYPFKRVAWQGDSQFPWESPRTVERRLGRTANDPTSRVHRLKMLGNGQVPACTYVIGKMIMEIEQKVLPQ